MTPEDITTAAHVDAVLEHAEWLDVNVRDANLSAQITLDTLYVDREDYDKIRRDHKCGQDIRVGGSWTTCIYVGCVAVFVGTREEPAPLAAVKSRPTGRYFPVLVKDVPGYGDLMAVMDGDTDEVVAHFPDTSSGRLNAATRIQQLNEEHGTLGLEDAA